MCPDGRIFLETASPYYKQASSFLIEVAEPVSCPEFFHEYVLTPHSLYAAASSGHATGKIITTLNLLSKTRLPQEIEDFISESTLNYGKVSATFPTCSGPSGAYLFLHNLTVPALVGFNLLAM